MLFIYSETCTHRKRVYSFDVYILMVRADRRVRGKERKSRDEYIETNKSVCEKRREERKRERTYVVAEWSFAHRFVSY